jgi:hypothetical protein
VGQASVTVTVSAAPGLELIPPRPQAVEPGSSAKLLFLLRNTGNVADRVALAAQSPFPVTVPAGEIPLDVGERREIPIEIKIPKGAPSARVRVTLQATSRLFQISATATAVVEILPPLPQDVKGTLFLTIPSEVGFQIEGQTGLTLSASIAIRELGGALVPDRPAVRLNVGGSPEHHEHKLWDDHRHRLRWAPSHHYRPCGKRSVELPHIGNLHRRRQRWGSPPVGDHRSCTRLALSAEAERARRGRSARPALLSARSAESLRAECDLL